MNNNNVNTTTNNNNANNAEESFDFSSNNSIHFSKSEFQKKFNQYY